MFSRAKPKLAVYDHPLLFANARIKPYSFDELVQLTRKTDAGPLIVGKDPMTFVVATNGVRLEEM